MLLFVIEYRGAFDWSDKKIHKTNSDNMVCESAYMVYCVDYWRHETNKLFYLFNRIRLDKSHRVLEWPKTENETSDDEQKAENDQTKKKKIKAIDD